MKTLFFLLITFSLSAQIKGIIKDSITGQPIPFVNIWVENEEIGTTSDIDGSFSLVVIDSSKNLIFSAIGYESALLKATDCNNVILKSIIYQLNEVVVTRPKKTKEITIGTLNEKQSSSSLFCGNKPLIIAKYFKTTDEIKRHPFLKEIIFETFSFKNDVRMILHFYEVNDDGSPGEELIDKNYFIFIKKGSKTNKINIEKMNLSFSEKGIFFGVEWLIIEANKYINKKNAILHMPMLTINQSEEETYWEKISGKWLKHDKLKYKDSTKEAFLDLAVNLTLTN